MPDHKPYDLSTPDAVAVRCARHPVLSGKYPVATGLEHDEMGHPTGSPKLHREMTGQTPEEIADACGTLPMPKVYGPPEGNVLLVGWGSTQGPIREAVDRARAAGDSVSAFTLAH